MSISDAQYAAWLAADGKQREILAVVECNHLGAEITRYLSRYGYTTKPGEAPASTPFLACLSGGLTFERSIGITAGDPSIQVSAGDLEVENRDGRLDAWFGDVWVKRGINIYLGDPTWAFADFRVIVVGTIADIQPQGRHAFKFRLSDKMERLNFPISQTLAGGTTNPTALLPLAFGEVYNATPLLVDAATLKYAVHAGAVESIIEVRDSGLTVNNTPTVAAGTFTLNQARYGQITCDIQGAKVGGVYLKTVAKIIEEIVTHYGAPGQQLAPAEIDAANFTAWNAAYPQTIGLYVEGKRNLLEVCASVLRSLQASMYFSRAGLLRLWGFPPSIGAAAVEFTKADIVEDSIEFSQFIPAAPAAVLGWGKNWTVQTSGMAGGVLDAVASSFGREYLDVVAQDAAAVTLYRYTTAPTREETLLVVQAEAQTEANRRVSWRSTMRRIVRFTARSNAYLRELGEYAGVTHDRLGGRIVGIIIGIREDLAANRVTLEVVY